MVKRYALMESVSSNLYGFLKQIGKNLSILDKKFLRDAFIGLLRAGRPIVCQMARQLPNQRAKFVSRVDRLEQHLTNDSGFGEQVKESLPQVWLPFVKDDTPIILDLSDLAKPYAKKMDYLATVRDGNTGELVNGYWLLELYASLSRKNPVPMLLEPFSHEEPCSPGQNPIVLKAIHRIFELTNKHLVLLVALVMVYLGWVIEAHPSTGERLFYLSQPLPDEPDFIGYRLLAGLIEAVNACFWLHKELLRRPL